MLTPVTIVSLIFMKMGRSDGWDLGHWEEMWGINWRDSEKPIRMTYHEFIGNPCSSQGTSASRCGIGHLFSLEVGMQTGTPMAKAVKKATLVSSTGHDILKML